MSVSNEVDVIVPTPNPFIGHFVCQRNNDVEIMPATVFRKSGEKIRAEKKIINIVALILRPFFFVIHIQKEPFLFSSHINMNRRKPFAKILFRNLRSPRTTYVAAERQ